jgi:DNA-binding beta-propeller fold protein YncE
MNKAAHHPFSEAVRKSGLVSILAVSFLFATLVCSSRCLAQSAPKTTLLALSKSDHTLAIVDPVTLKVVARVPVGPDPHEVIASSDGRTAYVSNYAGGALYELDIIDLVAQKALPHIDTRPLIGLHGLTFAAGKLWFTAEGSKSIGRFDPATSKIDWCMGTGQDRTHMIYVTEDGKRIYTTNVASGTVSILVDTLIQPGPPPGAMQGPPGAPGGQPAGSPANPPPGAGAPPKGGPGGFGPQGGPRPHMDWVQTLIPVGKGSEGFDVSPDGRELWTAAADDGAINIIDIASKKVTAKIDAGVVGANRLKFTPDGKRVLITSLRNGDLFVYDAGSHQLLKRLNTGRGAAGILVDTDGSRAFIGCTADNYVAVIDLQSLTVTGHIDVGGGPDGLAWAIR